MPRQIVKMATGIRLNLNSACGTADMRDVAIKLKNDILPYEMVVKPLLPKGYIG